MEKGEYTGTAAPGYGTYRILSSLRPRLLPSFFSCIAPTTCQLLSCLDVSIFLILLPFGLCLHHVLVDFSFLFSPQCSFFGGKSSAAVSQLRSFIEDLKPGQFAPARNQTHCITDLCLAVNWPCLFACSPLLSQLADLVCPIMEPTRTASIPGLHLPHLPRSLVWWHLFPSSAFSFLFSFTVDFSFISNCQILPWCNFSFLVSFSVTVGELVGNVTLYSHPFCQPGSHVTPVMVVNQSGSLGLVTKNFGLTFRFSHFFLCWSSEIRAVPCPSLSSPWHVGPCESTRCLALGQPKTGERASAERIRASVVISLMRLIFFFHLSWQDQNAGIVARLQEPGSIPSGGSVPAPATVNGYTMRNHLLKQQIMKRQLMQVRCRVPLWVPVLSTSLGRTGLTGMGKSPVSKH